MSDTKEEPTTSPADTLLGYFPYTLPSRGVFYVSDDEKKTKLLPGGVVHLKKMRAKEQALLQQTGGGIAGKLKAIVTACTQPVPGLPPSKFLLVDRFAILLALRTKTFGPEYAITYNCSTCGERNHLKVNIQQDFSETIPEEGAAEPFEIELPESGDTLSVRFLRGEDEDQVMRHANRLQMTSNDASDPSYLYRLALQVVTIKGEAMDVVRRQRYIENMDALDLIELEDRMNKQEPGIDTRLYPECEKCQQPNAFPMPMQGEFFRPGRRN